MVARAFKQRNTPHLFFSPDGNHLACSGPVGEKFRVYVDGKLSNDYDAVQDLVWSADGQHWAYCASRKDGESAHYYLIQDGKETAVPTGVRDVHFSPDGRHVYYVAVIEVGAGERIVSDGKPGEIYDRVGPHAFSADGEHYAFWTQKEKTWTLFFDGKPCVATSSDPNWRTYWDFVHAPIFTNKNTLEFLAIRDDGIYRVTQSLVAK
jgi:WD40 repeat protein